MHDPPRRPSTPLRLRAAALLVPLLAATGCTFDYADANVEGEDQDSIPQLEIFDARMVIERDNRLELEAGWIASYPAQLRQEFRDLSFREYGPDGDLRLEGYAERGILQTDVENVELLGTVRFYSELEEAQLTSSYLFWDNADRVLTGAPDDEVTITREDGTRLLGTGLRVDGRRNSVEFSGSVRGRYTTDADDDTAGDGAATTGAGE